MATTYRCMCCGETISPQWTIWLVMDGSAHTYHSSDDDIPAGHINQGGFPFGMGCAITVLKNGGVLPRRTK